MDAWQGGVCRPGRFDVDRRLRRRPGPRAASLLWRNRDHDFPAWAGHDLTAHDPTARLALLASDGATSATVAGDQVGRLRRLGVIPTLATVTMGGNDLLAAYGDSTAGRLGLPPWPEALELLAELNRAWRALAEDHQAPVADVHARFLGHGLAAGDPTQPAARPPDRGLWYCGLIEPNAWGASEIRACFWETLRRAGSP